MENVGTFVTDDKNVEGEGPLVILETTDALSFGDNGISFLVPNEKRLDDGVEVVVAVDDFAALGPNKLFISNLGLSASLPDKLLTSK